MHPTRDRWGPCEREAGAYERLKQLLELHPRGEHRRSAMQQVSKWDGALRNERFKKNSTLWVQYLEQLRFVYGDICRATATLRDVDPFSFEQHPSRSETGLTSISQSKYVKASVQSNRRKHWRLVLEDREGGVGKMVFHTIRTKISNRRNEHGEKGGRGEAIGAHFLLPLRVSLRI
jgi:hypothetical protein